MSKKKSKKKRVIILVLVAVLVALGVVGYIGWQKNIADTEKTTYEIVQAQKGTVEIKVKGAGTVAALDDHTAYAGFTGTVTQVLAEDGDIVGAGDVIAVFESDALASERDTLEQQIDDIDTAILSMRGTTGRDTIYSSVEGIVKAIYAKEGDSVDAVMEQYGTLAVVCPDERMNTVIPAEELKLNDIVTVTVGETSVQGVVESIENAEASVGFEDDDFALGDSAAVTSADGAALGSGTVEIANPVYITGRGGIIEDIKEDVGGKVSRYGKLFVLDGEILSSDLYAQIDQRADLQSDLDDVLADIEGLTVYAGADGVISGLDLNEEEIVQEGTPLFTVEGNDAVKIDVEIDELDIANIELGETASVTFDALPESTFEAEIVKINPLGVAENNVTNFTITLSLNKAEGVMIGMSADVQIISQKAEDVLIIPVEAIQIVSGEKYVVLESDIDEELDSTPATHKVTTGITDGVSIEILDGLNVGDRVAVPQVTQNVQAQMMNIRDNAEAQATE